MDSDIIHDKLLLLGYTPTPSVPVTNTPMTHNLEYYIRIYHCPGKPGVRVDYGKKLFYLAGRGAWADLEHLIPMLTGDTTSLPAA